SGEMVVGREFEKTGVEMDGLSTAFQDHAAEIVGQNGSRRPTPIGEGMDVAEEKILQGLVEEELQPQSATVGEGEDEAGQTTAGATDGHFPEVGPVGLRLLAGEGAKTQKSFPLGRAQFGHDTAELGDAAGVAARADHLQETGSAQARILLQGLT